MSRSDEEWESAWAQAVKLRELIYDAHLTLEEWPIRFEDVGEAARRDMDGALGLLVRRANELVGAASPEWLHGRVT